MDSIILFHMSMVFECHVLFYIKMHLQITVYTNAESTLVLKSKSFIY